MAEPLWRADELMRATGGSGRAADVTGVTFDTREIAGGELFVALQGARDGHAFVEEAFGKGAAAALVSREIAGAGPQIVVDDTLVALNRLGAAARDRCPGKRAAVTGSVGKTSVTQAVLAGLKRAGRAHGAVKSFNNHIGVPTTLSRMPRDTERAVFEIGMNHAGEIAPLSELVRPHVATITTVGPVHVENFADGEAGVAREKGAIFAGLAPGGTAVLPRDSGWYEQLARAALDAGAGRVVSFGEHPEAEARLTAFGFAASGAEAKARIGGREVTIPLRQSGAHWGPNSLAVLLTLDAMDVPLETGVEALGAFDPLAGRGAQATLELPQGRVTLIDESYNANPISMAATLKTLGARRGGGRRIVALTDMLELGETSPRFHGAVAEQVATANVDLVFCAGPAMHHLWERLPRERRGGYARDAAGLIEPLMATLRDGDVVMVKGSNGSRAGQIAAALREAAAGGKDG